MPAISLEHVVSCSSADPNNPAENLLKADGVHKWKGRTVGEKSLSLVLQFSKSSQIHSIDIGNEGSAFVEILVGKATALADQDFEVLLVASSFMSPLESRNGTNRNSVRMFGPDRLNKLTSCQKWDRVKIVCSQPFSKLHQYGLSFMKFHSPPEEEKEVKVKKFGAFTMKKDSDEDDITIGSVFAKRSFNEPAVIPKAAAAVRAATRVIEEKQKPLAGACASPDGGATPNRRRPASPPLAYNNNLKIKVAKVSSSNKEDGNGSDTEDEDDTRTTFTPKPVTLKKQSTSISSVASSHSGKSNKTNLNKSKTLPPSPSPNVSYEKLMAKVVFVLSGFQNPYRGEIRDKAMEMGATYKPDWGRGCTHLVCAFANTPKYQQVRAKGRIVTKRWVLECSKEKKLLPWRRYRLGDAPSPGQSSDEEEEPLPSKRPERRTSLNATPSSTSKAGSKKERVQYDESDSDPDTEEELRKAHEEIEREKRKDIKKKATPEQTPKRTKEDPYDVSTDEEENDTLPLSNGENDNDEVSESALPELPDFFTDKYFFFYGDFGTAEKRLLTRYIAAYNGEVEDYMNSKVNFVVTSQKWDDNFDDALSENSKLIFVKPKWILTCHEKVKYLPYQPYVVSL